MVTMSSRGSEIPGGAQPAVPAERSDTFRQVVTPRHYGHAEPPTVAIEVATDQAGRLMPQISEADSVNSPLITR